MDTNNEKGQSLGGGRGQPLTAAEIRERRLTALLGSNSQALTASLLSDVVSESKVDMKQVDLDEDEQLQQALSLSLQKEVIEHVVEVFEGADAKSSLVSTMNSRTIEFLDIAEFHSIMWDSRVTTNNDKDRWVGQGIDIRHDAAVLDCEDQRPTSKAVSELSRLEIIGSNHLPWGLAQAHGGPCGVMAAVQAELLRILLFSPSSGQLTFPEEQAEHCFELKAEIETSLVFDPQRIQEALAMAMAIIIARASLMPNVLKVKEREDEARIVLPVVKLGENFTGFTWEDFEPWSSTDSANSDHFLIHSIPLLPSGTAKRQRVSGIPLPPQPVTRAERIICLAKSIVSFFHETHALNYFTKPGGVVLLVMCVVASRGASTIIRDMDDDASMLTSQFGHCSQELINLLLTGQAVSNVFDNVMTPSGSLTCYGIQQRPSVGYLTQLESLRYCEVGGYYKNPCFPLWVIGSTSHFTVLFGEVACLKESKSDALLEKCRRAFKEVDGVDNGFVSRLDLHKVYELLEFDVGGDHAIQTLAAALEVSGADIILWDDFWKATSRLMTGASLESVLQGHENVKVTQISDQGEAMVVSLPGAAETDEEMAKRLAAEWGWPTTTAAVSSDLPFSGDDEQLNLQSAGVSDEEYARKLQAQFDSMGGVDASSQGAVNSDDFSMSDLDDDQKMSAVVDHATDGASIFHNAMESSERVIANLPTSTKPADFETFGDTFTMYHYNGLRGGTLTPFRVTRLTAEEAVGASIAMHARSGTGGATVGGDLEDVVRTKWPSCMINWLGKSPPYID